MNGCMGRAAFSLPLSPSPVAFEIRRVQIRACVCVYWRLVSCVSHWKFKKTGVSGFLGSSNMPGLLANRIAPLGIGIVGGAAATYLYLGGGAADVSLVSRSLSHPATRCARRRPALRAQTLSLSRTRTSTLALCFARSPGGASRKLRWYSNTAISSARSTIGRRIQRGCSSTWTSGRRSPRWRVGGVRALVITRTRGSTSGFGQSWRTIGRAGTTAGTCLRR